MRRLHPACSSPWHSLLHTRASPRQPALAFFIPRRSFRATAPAAGLWPRTWPRLRVKFRFRPIPSYGILLVAQLCLIYAVVHDLNNTEDTAYGDESIYLNTSTFIPYTLIHKEPVSANSCILTLQPTPIVDEILSAPSSWNPWAHLLFFTQRLIAPNLERRKRKLKVYQDDLWKQGIWSVEIKQPQLMIARRYTPLPPDQLVSAATSSSEATEASPKTYIEPIRLLVRREPQGEVSRYLHSLPEGATLELRGGFVEFELPTDLKDVVFLAGGTGIAPALGLANTLATRGVDARVRVLWANRKWDDCVGGKIESTSQGMITSLMQMAGLGQGGSEVRKSDGTEIEQSTLVRQLSSLQNSSLKTSTGTALDFSAKYFVDEEDRVIGREDIVNSLSKLAPRKKSLESSVVKLSRDRLVLVSGPDGFVEYIAGPKILRNGIELQGPIRGLLGQANLSGWHVWKL